MRIVQERLRRYPAVALVGPRQCGKTTLARSLSGRYFDLETEADRFRLDLEWDSWVRQDELLILDEAQAWPEVFPRLRSAIDADRRRFGRFLLLGSVSPALMTQVSESLAGRLSLVELTPITVDEVPPEQARGLWLGGGYPEPLVLGEGRFPQWQKDYVALLCQRDLPMWGLPAKPQVTQRLARMLAAVHGQVWNASQLGKSLGLSYHTVNDYVDYLEGAFLVRRLPAFHANLKKRLVKSPKVYWRDSGLLHALLRVANEDELLHQPRVGASWEGFVIEQVCAMLAHAGRDAQAFHFRTSDRKEIDLVLDLGPELWAVEAKLTASPTRGDMAQLDKAANLIGADKRILVSQTPECLSHAKRISCHLPWLAEHIANL